MLKRWLPFSACLALLGGMTAERWSLQPPKSAVAFHARVRAAADRIPMRFGPWVGQDEAVTADARRMLRPNVAVNRRYRNMSTGREVGFLFVQCDDARAIMDHYPPVCYVVQGYDKDAARSTDWQVGGNRDGTVGNVDAMTIPGTEYEFTRRDLSRGVSEESGIVVDNFVVMPDGTIRRDMDEAKAASGDSRRRFFGAAQFQLVFKRGVPPSEREAVFEAFAGACRPVIEAAESGLIH